MMLPLFIHEFIPSTAVEGPGQRACLWVQGCSIRCSGCMVPHTWDTRNGKETDTATLAQTILSIKDIEGLTILGGEPMDQAAALLPLLQTVKQHGLSLMLFSGYTKASLIASGCPFKKAIIELCDIFVDGPYIKDLTDFSRPWVGSSNQNIYFQSPKYKHLEHNLSSVNNKIEIRIEENGAIKLNGMLPKEKFTAIQKMLKMI
jgi:anaerobic ribonucleoside-triphosphate reductase activating protein